MQLTYRPGRLAKNTLWVTLGDGLRTLIQAGYFVLIARSLGAQGYGAFAGVVALISILLPFSGWGGGNLLVKHVARDPATFNAYWGRALVLIAGTGTPLIAIAYGVSRVLLPPVIPPSVVLAVAVSDLLFLRLLRTAGQAFQAFQQLRRTASLAVLLSCSRLAAVSILVLTVDHPTPRIWAWFYLAGTALSALVSCWLVSRELGSPVWSISAAQAQVKEGFYFSTSISAQRVYGEIDKTLLTRLAGLEAAGIYSAAYRLLQVALIPALALAQSAYARFFQHGEKGIEGSANYARRLLPFALGYALLASVAIYLAAPLLPLALGPSYHEAVAVARWLAVLPALMVGRSLIANALTGAGLLGRRSGIEVSTALFNLGANLALIPLFSWRGAVIATVLSELLLLTGLGWVVKRA